MTGRSHSRLSVALERFRALIGGDRRRNRRPIGRIGSADGDRVHGIDDAAAGRRATAAAAR